MEWLILDVTENHRIERCEMPYGEWWITQITFEKGREATIKFKPAKPEGWVYENYRKQMAALDAIHGKGSWTSEHERLHRYVDLTEVGYTQSFVEAKLFVEFLDRGSEGLLPATEQLLANGFEHSRYSNARDTFTHKEKSNLSVRLWDYQFHMTYSTRGGASWENVMALNRYTGPSKLLEVIWPEQIKDYQAVAAAYALEVAKRRIARGGLFRKPL